MKAIFSSLLLIAYAVLTARCAVVVTESERIVEEVQSTISPAEKSAAELQNAALTEPIDHAKELLLDLDEKVKQILPDSNNAAPAESDAKPQVYAAAEAILNQDTDSRQISITYKMNDLLDSIDGIEKRLQNAVQYLSERRRYAMSMVVQPTLNYVQGLYQSLERLQNRISINGGRQGGNIDQTIIDNIRKQVESLNRTVDEIINRVMSSLGIRSAPTNNSPSQPTSSSTSKPSV